MMREILFRGKRKNDGEWIEGYLVELGKESFSDTRRYGICNKAIPLLGNGVCYNLRIDEVIPETIRQFTGLTDKNGKKMFEGDIVKADNGHISEIVFHFGAFRCYCQCHDELNTLWSDILTVIGNIHDNVELLKATEVG